MLSNATSTAWIRKHQRKGRQGEEDDRSGAVRTGPGQRGADTEGRREVDAPSRQRTAPLPEKVWQALTDPAHLHEWAPFDTDGSLGTVGTTVKLTTVGAPTPQGSETTVTRADAPKLLEYK